MNRPIDMVDSYINLAVKPKAEKFKTYLNEIREHLSQKNMYENFLKELSEKIDSYQNAVNTYCHQYLRTLSDMAIHNGKGICEKRQRDKFQARVEELYTNAIKTEINEILNLYESGLKQKISELGQYRENGAGTYTSEIKNISAIEAELRLLEHVDNYLVNHTNEIATTLDIRGKKRPREFDRLKNAVNLKTRQHAATLNTLLINTDAIVSYKQKLDELHEFRKKYREFLQT